jgi:hypothetical protein
VNKGKISSKNQNIPHSNIFVVDFIKLDLICLRFDEGNMPAIEGQKRLSCQLTPT